VDIVSQIVDGRILSQVMTLPVNLQNILVEVTVKPAAQNVKQPSLTRSALKKQLKGSHTESMLGILPAVNISLVELRAERRLKYENHN